jgi:hypothetical protein
LFEWYGIYSNDRAQTFNGELTEGEKEWFEYFEKSLVAEEALFSLFLN